MQQEWNRCQEILRECRKQIAKEIVGQEEIVSGLLMGMLSGGNVLLEGMPGLGKTRLVTTISRVFDLSFKRIQFTPDLMPQDITGTSILMRTEQGSSFTFRPGPVFANIVLADEINRATPKTQSAMLEAMQEGTVTEGGKTYELPKPFFVLATQNPIETEGTYPLPEAQLDRFLCKLNLDFPSKDELKKIVYLTEYGKRELPQNGQGRPEEAAGNEAESQQDQEALMAQRVCGADDLMRLQDMTGRIEIADSVMDYLVELVEATHENNPYIREGVSPRGAQAMLRLSRARAFLQGRYNISFEDLQTVIYPALCHRIILSFDAISDRISAAQVIDDILKKHPARVV